MIIYKSALKLSSDRQRLQTPLAPIARDRKFDESDMKYERDRKMSFKFTCLKRAGIACFVGLLAVACAPPPPPPVSPASTTPTQERSSSEPIQSAPANVVSSASQPLSCKITMAKVADPQPPTNVRSSPEVRNDNIVAQIKTGILVSVQSEKEGWFEISNPVKGWISKTVTQSDCNEKTQRVSFPANSTSTSISSRFIGTGSHVYLLKANQGQTLTVTVQEGPLPFIFPPNDPHRQKELTGGGGYSDKKNWTGQLLETGDYILQLESNRSGYPYKFSVEAK